MMYGFDNADILKSVNVGFRVSEEYDWNVVTFEEAVDPQYELVFPDLSDIHRRFLLVPKEKRLSFKGEVRSKNPIFDSVLNAVFDSLSIKHGRRIFWNKPTSFYRGYDANLKLLFDESCFLGEVFIRIEDPNIYHGVRVPFIGISIQSICKAVEDGINEIPKLIKKKSETKRKYKVAKLERDFRYLELEGKLIELGVPVEKFVKTDANTGIQLHGERILRISSNRDKGDYSIIKTYKEQFAKQYGYSKTKDVDKFAEAVVDFIGIVSPSFFDKE